MPKFIRFKQEGFRVLEVDVSIIKVLQVERCDDKTYSLLAFSATQSYALCNGTFDECHTMLNSLHDILSIQVVDL